MTDKKFTIEDKEKWYGESVEAKSDPIIDPGTGKTLILRWFEFAINPEIKHTPTKQELFNAHWKQISTMLWGDGLVPRQDINPRVEIGKKRGKGKYRIFVLCEPRLGTFVAEKPQNLQEMIKPSA